MIPVSNSALSQHCQSPQFQTSLFRSGLGTGLSRLSCIHRTPETKFSNKIPYNYTTVKPQLAALAKHFFAVWLFWHSPI